MTNKEVKDETWEELVERQAKENSLCIHNHIHCDCCQELRHYKNTYADNYKLGFKDGKKEALEDELRFLDEILDDVGSYSLTRDKTERRITEIKQKLESIKLNGGKHEI